MSPPYKTFSKEVKALRIAIAAGLAVLALRTIANDYVKNLEIENCIISCQALLQSGTLLLFVLLLLIPFHLIPYIKNKRKNTKHYSSLQIEIAEMILDKDIQSVNDFFIEKYKPKPLDKPFNTTDERINFFIEMEHKDAMYILNKFKDLISDLIKYEYIELKKDNAMPVFACLKRSEYWDATNGKDKFLELNDLLDGAFKQKQFMIINPKKLKKLTRKKKIAFPENKN